MPRYISAALLLASIAWVALSKEIYNPPRQLKYDSGAVHEEIMDMKQRFWESQAVKGGFNSTQYRSITDFTPCTNGYAGQFRCNNVDLYSFYTHSELGSETGRGSSSWGWVHDGREFIVIAQADGAAIAEVTKDGKLDYLGRLPKTPEAKAVIWRELRVLDPYLVVGSEAKNHHVQIFDLRKILDIKTNEKPRTFDPKTDLTALWKGLPLGRTHNIVINWDLGYIVSVGSMPRNSTFQAGLVFIDIEDPTNPKLAGYQAEDGYVHDAQCLTYHGPDERYEGDDLCYGYNEDTLTIYNVTDKVNSTIISRTSYDGASYTHQGWVLDPKNQHYLLMDDETDEIKGVGPAKDGRATTYIWDISNLEKPKQTGIYKSVDVTIDHNQYIHNGRSYQSNYGNGLHVLDLSSIPSDPTGKGVKELGFFDIYPEDDSFPSHGQLAYQGTWSNYPFFPSGYIVINTIERGAFVVKLND